MTPHLSPKTFKRALKLTIILPLILITALARILLLQIQFLMSASSSVEHSGQIIARAHRASVRRAVWVVIITAILIARHGVLEPGLSRVEKPFMPDALISKVREVLDIKPEAG